ncbi:hypothetical protein B0H14DRAFT_2597602 [Mycena olivaceomarginata]|nr:hypothetical protein B0H14DRAFT_2597602 [Mycena olivaceomarginata]
MAGGTLLGFSLPLVLSQATSFDTIYLAGYSSFLLMIWTILSASNELALIVHMVVNSVRTFGASCTASSIPPNVSRPGFYSGDVQTVPAEPGGADMVSDDDPGDADENDEPDSNAAGPSSKHKRKTIQPLRPRKRQSKGKGKASDDESDSETGIRVTLGGKNGAKGMFVDEESYLYDAPEFWDVSAHHVAIILDVSDTPECLQGNRKLMSVDAYIKKQCQDAWTGPTGSKKTGLALATILDEGKMIQCRRSNLKCNGFYTCSLASPDHLLGFERWDVESDVATRELISGPMFKSKNAEGMDIVTIATALYRSTTNQHCKAKGDGNGQFECGTRSHVQIPDGIQLVFHFILSAHSNSGDPKQKEIFRMSLINPAVAVEIHGNGRISVTSWPIDMNPGDYWGYNQGKALGNISFWFFLKATCEE